MRIPKIPKLYWTVGGFFALLMVLRPFSITVGIPVALLLMMGAAVLWFVGYYGYLYIRAKSPIVVTDSAMRQSANMIHPLAETDLGGEPFPPMSLFLVGGGAAMYTAISDKDALFVRKSATEVFGQGKRVLLVYAPTQPLPGWLIEGIAAPEADQAKRASFSGFVAKGNSQLHFSLLDSLHGIDSQSLRAEQAYFIDKHAKLAAERRAWVQAGSRRFINELRALAAAARRETPREKWSRFFTSKPEQDVTAEAEKERIK